MQTVFKTLLAITLGFGFLALGVYGKPSVAFLGFNQESDPLIRNNLGTRIQFELAADTGLSSFSTTEVEALFIKGILTEPDVTPKDMPILGKVLGAQYYAFGRLELLDNSSKRIWWKPWRLKVTWTQGIRLRVLEAESGKLVFDGEVTGQLAEKGFLTGPEPFERLTPLEKNSYRNRMLGALALETSKTLAKVIKEKTAPAGTVSKK